jgi:Ala-tRNA(Pro) deacylase
MTETTAAASEPASSRRAEATTVSEPAQARPYDRIVELLRVAGVEFRAIEHEPVRTSEEAARVRGTPLEQGAKALVLRAGDGFVMAVISAARRVDFQKLKRLLGTEKPRFASADEVDQQTGCPPGGVPPFGNLFGLKVVMDPTLAALERIDFNAGERTRSIEMSSRDYIRIVQPQIADIAADEPRP